MKSGAIKCLNALDGGLYVHRDLTTVGDLLRWTTNFASPKVGDAAFVRTQIEPGRFSDDHPHGYAMGLQVGVYKGVRAISHGGATAGYWTQLSLFPDQDLAVAVLCNAANADAGSAANAVADIFLGNTLKAPAAPSSKYTLNDYRLKGGRLRARLKVAPRVAAALLR